MNYYNFFLLLILLGIFSCSKNQLNNNPYLQDISFEKVINLNLPQYDNLKYSGGSIYLQSGGIKGLLLFNINDQIMAWEASCPNQYPSSCSKMTINGVQSVCSCEDFKYSLATGQILSNSEKESYPMKLYYSEKNGNSVRISN
jgi:nitrite reductase/ring-hydroxylating ferredoxin subunit|tara:strand:+ start:74 stop:502 length:429 start_codon:yes stop_codon:yes gene_type:complete